MKTRISNPFRSGIPAIITVLTLGCFTASSVSAATRTWDGGNVDPATAGQWNVNTFANWDAAIVNGDDLVFGTTNANGWTLTSVGAARTIKSLTFQSGSPAYDIRLSSTVSSGTSQSLTFNNVNTGITVELGDTSSHNIGIALGSLVLEGNLTATHNGSGTLTISRPINDGASSFGLTKEGTGTMKLLGANTYNGATQVNGGILVIGNTAAEGTTSSVTAGASGTVGLGVGGAGYYTYTNVVDLFNTNTLAGFSLNAASGVAIDTTNGNISSQSAALTGGRGLTILGTGLAQFNVTNTYTGPTIIKQGSLNLGAGLGGGRLSTSSTITIETGAGFGIFQNDAVVQGTDFSGAPITGGGEFYIVGSPTVTLNAANSYTGPTTIAGGLLKHEGLATLTSGNLTFDGTTVSGVYNGVLGLTSNFTRALGTGDNQVQWTASGGFAAFGADCTVSLNGGGNVQWGAGSFAPSSRGLILGHADATHKVIFANNINFSNAVRAIQVDDGAAAVDATISGTLGVGGGVTGGFIKTGAGTLELTNTNLYTGTTTASTGRLIASANAPSGSAGALGNATSAVLLGSTDVASTATAALLTGGAFTIGRPVTVQAGSTGVASVGGNTDNTSTFGGAIGLNKDLTVTQVATTTTNALQITGGISSGTAGAKTLTFNNAGSVNVATTAIADGSGTVALTKSNSGTLTLSVANTYTGITNITAGVLQLSDLGAVGGSTGITIAGGATLRPTIDAITIGVPVTLGAVSTTSTINAPTLGASTNVNTLTLNGKISGAGNLKLNGSNGSNAFGTIVLGAANDYTGTTEFTCSATGAACYVKNGLANALPVTTVLNMNGGTGGGSGRTVQYDLNGFNQTLAGLSNTPLLALRNQRITNLGAAATLTINNTADYSFGGSVTTTDTTRARIEGAISLVKSGVGTFTLVEPHIYTGDTTVNAGILSIGGVNTSNNASTVTIAASGAKLKLNYAGTDTVNKLFIGATQQVAGTYGHTSSGATNGGAGVGALDAYFEAGTGTLTVTSGPVVGGYSSWQAANGPTTQTIDLDHDSDGVSNGVEYFLGGNTSTTGFTPLPGVTNTLGVLSVTWTKAASYTGVYNTNFVVETSATLAAPWTSAALGASPGQVVISGNNVTYTFPAGTKNFARLVVTGP